MHDYRKDYDLVLYGPDTKHGAKAKTGFKRYIWYIVWYENSGKRERSTGQSRFEDAQVFLQEEWLPSRVTVPNQALSLSQMEVNKALVLYATEHGPETSDPERVGYAVEALAPFWDGKTCGQVNTVNCKAYHKYRLELGLASSTVRRELETLAAALNYCVAAGYLEKAPSVWLPDKTEAKDRWLTRSEAAALIWAARKNRETATRLIPFILINLYTASRKTAALTLQWQENETGGWVDLKNAIIHWYPKGAKKTTKRRANKIPIHPRLLRFLKYQRMRTRRHVIEYQGGPMKDVKRSFNDARKAAWVNKDERGNPVLGEFADVTPHTLKHTSITWMLQRGVSIWDVSQYTGTSINTIEKVYGHHAPDHMQAALKAFG